jgi:hypothetical protein
MLEDLVKPTRVHNCRVRSILETLDAKDAAILLDAVMNHDWPYSTLENALRDKGISLSQGAIRKHRTKACSCLKISQ